MQYGMRQGGSTSQALFNGFIVTLISTRAGYYVNSVSVNNISYTNDIVLHAPSVSTLRKLLHFVTNMWPRMDYVTM